MEAAKGEKAMEAAKGEKPKQDAKKARTLQAKKGWNYDKTKNFGTRAELSLGDEHLELSELRCFQKIAKCYKDDECAETALDISNCDSSVSS